MKSSVSATGGSAVASVFILLSSACCIGPLAVAFSFLGLSTSAVLAIENVVGPFRPSILGLTTVLIGGGFYFAYRPEREACEDGKICALPGSRRVQRVALWMATSMFLVLLYFTYVHPNLDVLFGIYL